MRSHHFVRRMTIKLTTLFSLVVGTSRYQTCEASDPVCNSSVAKPNTGLRSLLQYSRENKSFASTAVQDPGNLDTYDKDYIKDGSVDEAPSTDETLPAEGTDEADEASLPEEPDEAGDADEAGKDLIANDTEENSTMPANVTFKCNVGHENWKLGWSAMKIDWCCKMKNMGCDVARNLTNSSRSSAPKAKAKASDRSTPSPANSSVTNATVANTSVANASIANTSVANATVANSSVANASVANASVANATVANASVSNASVSNANESVANTSMANISVANTSIANDSAANTSAANVSMANASVANTSVANVSVANTSEANFESAIAGSESSDGDGNRSKNNSSNTTNSSNSSNVGGIVCSTRKSVEQGSWLSTISLPGTPCIFGVDPRDEGEHCIFEASSSSYGSFGWCYTSEDGSSWGSCDENCPLVGPAKVIGKKIDDLRTSIEKSIRASTASQESERDDEEAPRVDAGNAATDAALAAAARIANLSATAARAATLSAAIAANLSASVASNVGSNSDYDDSDI